MRAQSGRSSTNESGALWLSDWPDLVTGWVDPGVDSLAAGAVHGNSVAQWVPVEGEPKFYISTFNDLLLLS